MIDYKLLKSTLESRIRECDQVFIAPHLNADFDAIASAIGLTLIATKFGKPSFILMSDDVMKIEPGVKLIMSEYTDKDKLINMSKFLQLRGKNDLLITADVNKDYLVGVKDYLNDFKNIVIIDHHSPDDNTIKTNEEDKFISIEESSVSEIVSKLLFCFNIKLDGTIANFLLSGIYLDTDHLRKNTTTNTMKIAAKLLERGASIDHVHNYFEEDFNSDRKIQSLINKANFFTYTIAMAIEDENVQYTREELAKVADYLLKFKADATIAAGFIDDELISISARSKGKINVGEVMKTLGGGGNVVNAATKLNVHEVKCEDSDKNLSDDEIKHNAIQSVEKQLVRTLSPSFYILESEKK